jgi:hypothetical protein
MRDSFGSTKKILLYNNPFLADCIRQMKYEGGSMKEEV